MAKEKILTNNRPRFYEEPSTEDIELNGHTLAEINSRIRARIIGSRVLSASVAFGIGTLITVQEHVSGGDVTPSDLATNFVIPVIVNGIAEFKIERQLRHTGQEISELLPVILNSEAAPNNGHILKEE